jgi:acyl-coenzyme A synthetase/AMP-(fatty) acid ligase
VVIIDFHIYGLATVVLQGMWFGNFTFSLHAFDLELFSQKVEEHKATAAHIVPPVALQLATADIVRKYDLSSLEYIICSAAPLKVCAFSFYSFPTPLPVYVFVDSSMKNQTSHRERVRARQVF